jgi:hypothetical protein
VVERIFSLQVCDGFLVDIRGATLLRQAVSQQPEALVRL